jgi:SRSO17 transposase
MLDSTAVIGWSGRLIEVMDRLSPRFSRQDLRRRAEAYLRSLLGSVDRKNSWQLSEAAGAATPHGFQRLLGRARWDAAAVRDDLQCYVAEQLGDENGVLIFDETGFLKKGDKSAGVARQYSGTAGRIENCQIGVFAAYRSAKGHALVDRELYLPKQWTEDRQRCRAAGIPEERSFATKPELARTMLERVLRSNLPVRWVTADEVYGSDSKFRRLLENNGLFYVVAISCQQRLFLDGRYDRVDNHAREAPQRAWIKRSCGAGAKGERFYQWALVPFGHPTETGLGKGLLVRRSLEDPDARAYFFVHAPAGTPLKELVRVAGSRWAIEECFQQAKGQIGLDQYEVRSWTGWQRHVTLAMLAHAFLAAVRAEAHAPATKKSNVWRTSFR